MTEKLIGVGVGPGDPELITMKAWSAIKATDVISYIANEQGHSQSKTIARQVLSERETAPLEIPVVLPMSEDRTLINQRYDQAATEILECLQKQLKVVFLCEGDPLFFGSFSYLLQRLQQQCICEIIPGISSVHAASARLALPLTLLKESFAVVSGRQSQEQLESALKTYDSVVIMKAGRSRQKVLAAIKATNREKDGHYLEYIGRDGEKVISELENVEGEEGPYFSLFVVVKSERDQS